MSSMVPGVSLREARKRRGFTLEDVGRKLGVSSSTVSQWERDITSPRGHRMKKLMKILGLSLTITPLQPTT